MTATVTIRARAVPITVRIADDADPITIQPWGTKDFHVDGSMPITVTEAEPAADAPANDNSVDEAAAQAEEETNADIEVNSSYKRGRRAPSADSDSTQVSE